MLKHRQVVFLDKSPIEMNVLRKYIFEMVMEIYLKVDTEIHWTD